MKHKRLDVLRPALCMGDNCKRQQITDVHENATSGNSHQLSPTLRDR